MHYDPSTVEGRFLSGDRAAVAEVVRWIARVVASSSFWSLRSEWTDLHQEAMGRVLESLRQGRFDPSQEFRTYVQGVARFTALKALGRQVRGPVLPKDEDEVPELASPDRVEAEIETQQLARQVLDHATEDCRALMQAYFIEERSYAEIAESLAWPVGTVKSKLFRCLEAAHRAFGHAVGSPIRRQNPRGIQSASN